jgi:CIC family chloride channel protein
MSLVRPRLPEREFVRRLHFVLVLSAATGIATGVGVAGFDRLVRGLFDDVLRMPTVWAAMVPFGGLAIGAFVIRRYGSGDGATTDAYVRAYHQRGGELRIRSLPVRIAASVATLGSGGAMGYEGPAILIGGSIGSFAERRFTSRFTQDDAKVLMVAGAAAGVAAVFKAPLTGIVFALEVPYTQDVARRALLPALVAAGTSYLSFVAIMGTDPILSAGGAAPFDIRDLLGGAWAINHAKKLPLRLAVRVPLAGFALFVLALVTKQLFDAPLSLGSGYEAIAWAKAHESSLALLIALFFLRFAATWFTVAGAGVGGLFIPLVAQGAIAGQVVQAIVHAKNPGLFPTVGIAALLGGGYRTPLAGVAFVAEATGQPGFLVPALLAAAASQLAMGRWSFSPYQRDERRPEIAALDQLKIREVMSANPDTLPAEMAISDCARRMMADARRWVPVLDGQRYAGILALTDIARRPESEWATLRCIDVARQDLETAGPDESIADVASKIRQGGVGAIAITDAGSVIGVVTIRDIANVERLLDRLGPGADAH